MFSGALFPLLMAALVTIMLERSIRRLSSRMKLRKKAVSVAVVLFFYIIFSALISVLGFFIYKQAVSLVLSLPEEFQKVYSSLGGVLEKINAFLNSIFGEDKSTINDFSGIAITSFSESAARFLANALGGFAAAVPVFVISVFVMIAASAYLSKDYDEICKFIKQKCNEKTVRKIVYFKNNMAVSLLGMLKGYGVIMLITFSELFIGLTVLGQKYALITAAITAILDILPILGSGTVLVPWAVISFLANDKGLSFGLLGLYLIITAVRNVVEPKILGSKTGLPPIVMLISAFLGLRFFGASGIFSLPVAILAGKVILEGKQTNYVQNINPSNRKKKVKRISIIKYRHK